MPYTKDGGWVPAKGEQFRALTPDEVLECQEWAIENWLPECPSVYHPVCQQVWSDGKWWPSCGRES